MKATPLIVAAALTLTAIGAVIEAQQAGFKRTVLQQGDLSIPGREVVTAIAEFQPGGSVGRHTHPGEEVGYVLQGTILLEQQQASCTIIGNICCELLDIFICKQTHYIGS